MGRAASNNQRWWWPSDFSYWPGSLKVNSIENFIEVFGAFGYLVCDNSKFEPSYEKVAIYVKDTLLTHMARQIGPKQWASKCGKLEDIIHVLEGLEGNEYGKVKIIMKRLNPP